MAQSPRVSLVVNYILDGIARGRFAPGQRLTEADLIAACDVGSGPVREALRILAGEGVVEIVPNKGARVCRLSRKDLVDILRLIGALMAKSIRLSKDKLQSAEARPGLNAAMAAIRHLAAKGQPYEFMQALANYQIEMNRISDNEYLNLLLRQSMLVHFYRELANQMRIDDWDWHRDVYATITKNVLRGEVEVAADSFLEYTARLVQDLSETVTTIR